MSGWDCSGDLEREAARDALDSLSEQQFSAFFKVLAG
jgi:hypothetical protein